MKAHTLIALTVLAALAISCKGQPKTGNDNPETAKQIMTEDVTILKDSTSTDGTRILSVTPHGVCSRQIDVAVKDGAIVKVSFTGGCPGNTLGVSKLVEGMKVEEAISKLKGIYCAGKGTSCPDQLTLALEYFLN